MTKAERLIESVPISPFRVMNDYCPSDFEMEDMPGCVYRETGAINEAECVRCWCGEDKSWNAMPVPVKEE